jgi:hypothetical protein
VTDPLADEGFAEDLDLAFACWKYKNSAIQKYKNKSIKLIDDPTYRENQ